MTLPSDLPEGDWEIKHPIRERFQDAALYLRPVVDDDEAVGAYANVRENSLLAPGVFALGDLSSE